MIANKQNVLASIGRVAPFGQNHVVVNIVLLYTRDYGAQNPICFSASEHPGDVEHVAIDLEITGKGTAIVRTLFTTGHEGTEDDQSRRWKGADFRTLKFPTDPATSEPRWAGVRVAEQARYLRDEAAVRERQLQVVPPRFLPRRDLARRRRLASRAFHAPPKIENAGEAAHHLVDDLAHIGFAGEHVWGDQRFCGGVRVSSRKDCPPSIASKLAGNPFTR